jgi:lipopolysaccharide export system permease protein
MKTYTKFLIHVIYKIFFNVFLVMISLVFILNILKEIEFFSNKEVNSLYPIYLSLMSSPSIIFEMFPFIFLISTQFFFLKLFDNDEINIFKYSGLKNFKIINILSFSKFFYWNFNYNCLSIHFLQIYNIIIYKLKISFQKISFT